MSRPTFGAQELPKWLRGRWRQELFRFALLIFLVGVVAIWAVGAGFAVTALWRHGSDPLVAVFLGAWLLIWMSVPVAIVRGLIVGPTLLLQPTAEAAKSTARFNRRWGRLFLACFAFAWCAGLLGALREGDSAGFVLGVAFTAVPLLFLIENTLRRQAISIDALALEVCNRYGPLARTRRYELRLISAPRAEPDEDADGDLTGCWKIAFDYQGKTVRIGHKLSDHQARTHTRELRRLT
jgi:hypothetical protein